MTLDDQILYFAGGELGSRRRACELSQEELAEACGVHRTSIGRIERGEEDCSIVALSYLYFQLRCSGVLVDRRGIVPVADPESGIQDILQFGTLKAAALIWRMGEAVRSRRKAMRLTLDEVARMAGIHRNSLWSFERGLVSPSLSTYHRILRALEVARVTSSGGSPLFI
jgi:transcriptional regulator with XRE-family HTH domain